MQASLQTTRWSLISRSCAADGEHPEAQMALSEICKIYWRPIFSFILSRGRNIEDAQDLTQEFMAKISSQKFLRQVAPQKGSFRKFVWSSLQNFLIDEARGRQAKKRDWGFSIPLEEWLEEQATTAGVGERNNVLWTSEQTFDWRWAATLSRRALLRLREECARKGRERVFIELHSFLSQQAGAGEYQAIATVLGLREENIRTLISRLRSRYRQLLRAEVEATLQDRSAVDEELSYLFELLAQDPGQK